MIVLTTTSTNGTIQCLLDMKEYMNLSWIPDNSTSLKVYILRFGLRLTNSQNQSTYEDIKSIQVLVQPDTLQILYKY